MHWADGISEKIVNKRETEKYVVSSGITPSGHIHIGNARETLTADAIYKGLVSKGVNAELIFVADTYDPLRKVYPFLPEEYEKYIGMPLSEIPCPEGCCESYAEHFLKPFLDSLEDLGINLTTYRADKCYKDGLYDEKIILALENRDKIKEILDKYRKEPLPENWYPLNVICEECGKQSSTKVIEYDSENQTVTYECSCGFKNTVKPFKGRAKLPWRVDWPARWSIFNVVAEPMGKDHAASGGSYDTGLKIAREIYNYRAPEKIVYEWIQLKIGDKAVPMSSSSGVVFAVKDWMKVCHPEVLRFLLLRSKPTKHIDFDLKAISNLVDDYDELERNYFALKDKAEKEELNENEKDKIRLYELITPNIPEKLPLQVPYRFCSIIAQIAYDMESKEINMERVMDILRRNNYDLESVDEYDLERLKTRLSMSRNWALTYGEKLEIIDINKAKEIYEELNEKQKEWIKTFGEKLKDVEFDAITLHELIYNSAKDLELNPKEAFQASYKIILGKKYGPKLGSFLASLNKDFVVDRYCLSR
ncbi:lysine--tRNA ligase [Methanothermococcus thermolithotrophicus]|uniref:lysine--tRNA ligase n=1 Tax=Methanothermococcus thermolithotrophicus TaxID=2186 RepID=UPI00035DA186|nr:lysine--tRNA ligase [Methanothermococcus thermolithotrophicus]MDK2987340.1 lysyl-tRNA synthetase, class [Methanothermococcus sp.]